MKNNFFLLIPILFYTILSFSQNSTTDSDLCKELSKMLADDQKYRGSNLDEIYPILLDSLISAKGIDKEDCPRKVLEGNSRFN